MLPLRTPCRRFSSVILLAILDWFVGRDIMAVVPFTTSFWGRRHTLNRIATVAAWTAKSQPVSRLRRRRWNHDAVAISNIRLPPGSTTSLPFSLFTSSSSSSLSVSSFVPKRRLIYTAHNAEENAFKEQQQQQQLQQDQATVYKELQWLSREIRRHDELYYTSQLGPELSDEEFDALVQREERIAQEYPQLLQQWQEESGWGVEATRSGRVGIRQAAPNNTVTAASAADAVAANIDASEEGAPETITDRIKRKHIAPMLSLDNVHNEEQLWAWLKRIPKVLDEWDFEEQPTRQVTIVTEPKLDGVSLSLRYNNNNSNSSSSSSNNNNNNSNNKNNNSDMFELEWASTRGDGQQGQDVTAAVRSSMGQTIPLRFTLQHDDNHHPLLPSTIEIRGEVVLPKSHFERLSDWAPNVTFSNARNAVSGILLRKESEHEDDKLEADKLRNMLQFYAYDMVVDPQAEQIFSKDGEDIRQILLDIGFSIPLPISQTKLDLLRSETMQSWSTTTIAPMLSYYQALQSHRDDQKVTKGYDWGDFEMDGCVHKISEFSMRRLLGRSMKSPKWAVAHKFPPRAVVTKLLNVTVQIGRTGALTPVAVLEPVEVGGVTIYRATLHNFAHLQQVMGGTETAHGTSVLVRRAGDVIPQVVKQVGERMETENMISLEPPTNCPACGSLVIMEEIATSEVGQIVRCGGPPLLCPPRAVTSLSHAFSRDALDVAGLSEARIQHLMDAGLLRFPNDIFQFGDEEWSKVQGLPGWGPKSCQNLRKMCQRVATTGVSLSRFIYSLGVRHLGKHSSKLVASNYVTIDAFLEALDAASNRTEIESQDSDVAATNQPFSSLQGQNGIGPVLIQSMITYSKTKELVNAAKALGKAVKVLEEEAAVDESAVGIGGASTTKAGRNLPWKGFRVVFTGSIPGYSRSEAEKTAKLLGAKATPSSVSKSTDLLVFGEKGGKKLQQADSLGIQTMPAEDFVALVEENSVNPSTG